MKIKLYEKNAKIHTDKQLELLARIVAEIGWRQSVEVNQEGVIVVGHGRYLAWQKFKDKYNLPDVWIVDDMGKTVMGKHDERPLTEQQERMWRIADNQVNAMTGLDMKLAIPELKLLDDEMLDLSGFDKDLVLNENDFGEEFSLADGDKSNFQQITFTLANEQYDDIKNALEEIKQTDQYKYCETFGNENSKFS